ncbi:MAG: hypothetical protein PW734_10745 [Verrucomicrobium sp.]|nr:hypothetical protein [Verrucomicrobium sp.]
MSARVHILAQTMGYLEGGGHFWVYLNWAMGLRKSGHAVTWVESIDPKADHDKVAAQFIQLQKALQPYGFDQDLALLSLRPGDIPPSLSVLALTPARMRETDLLVNFRYGLPQEILDQYPRTALIDIDPGLLQHWVHHKQMDFARHDAYFTTGERIGGPGSKVPDLGLAWHPIRPCVAVDLWPATPSRPDAPFTTVSHWDAPEYVLSEGGSYYSNSKRSGFLPFLDLPQRVRHPMELALCISGEGQDAEDRRLMEAKGWRIQHSHEVAGSPEAYQRYIQRSYGEFSAAKPSCLHFNAAWMSDRTLCYLASGKPAVVQYTGPSSYLPSRTGDGLWRYETLEEAAAAVEAISADYAAQSRKARELAEAYFDSRTVAGKVVETALSVPARAATS